MSIITQSANNLQYWENVKRSAKQRKGLKKFEEAKNTIHIGQIYEQHLLNMRHAIDRAAKDVAIDHLEFESFLASCADAANLPELREHSLSELQEYATFARDEAIQLMNS